MHDPKTSRKSFWIAGSILLAIVLCGLMVWFGGGMVDMIRAHMGL